VSSFHNKRKEDNIETNLKLVWWEWLEWNNNVARDKYNWLDLTNM
jgi:hypothetical protein